MADIFTLPETFKQESVEHSKHFDKTFYQDKLKGKRFLTASSSIPREYYGNFRDINGVVDHLVPKPMHSSESRDLIYARTGVAGRSLKVLKVHAATAKLFSPVKVGNLSGSFTSYSYEGDTMPQFQSKLSQDMKRLDFICNLCLTYVHFCQKFDMPYTKLRKNADENADLVFEGIAQCIEHQHGPTHQEAINFWEAKVKTSQKTMQTFRSSQPSITKFITPKSLSLN